MIDIFSKLMTKVVLLIYGCGLPPCLVESEEWFKVASAANWRLSVFNRSHLKTVLIPSKASNVRALQIVYLRTQINLTLLFDGGSTRAQESFYIAHITTPDRRVFFLEAFCGDGESHTADWIMSQMFKVCYTFFYMCIESWLNDESISDSYSGSIFPVCSSLLRQCC